MKTYRTCKEIMTMDVCGDNKSILAEGVSGIEAYIEEVVPKHKDEISQEELLDVVVDVQEYLSKNESEHTFIYAYTIDKFCAILSSRKKRKHLMLSFSLSFITYFRVIK